MRKRYQAVCIEKEYYSNSNHFSYVVAVHDRLGKERIHCLWYHDISKTELLKCLRSDGVEVSKHVENGGELKTH